MRTCFYTFGCKLNQAETEELKQKLRKKNWNIVKNSNKAEIFKNGIIGQINVFINR